MSKTKPEAPGYFLQVPTWLERKSIAAALRAETVGGLILVAGAVLALMWANSPFSESYAALREIHFGPSQIGLHLSVTHWITDGLLTLFFLVAGIELKRELVVGELRKPASAALPVIAAACGMAVPAGVYLAASLSRGGVADGWAVPMATDIAFALAVLAIIGTHLPAALRAFLLTLAVVDDLGAIAVIAIFFTSNLNFVALGLAVVGLVIFRLMQQRGVRGWWWYAPLGIAIWVLTYNGGIHATVAGVAMGLLLRTHAGEGEDESPAARTEHFIHPISAAVVVPLFALMSAGVSLSWDSIKSVATTPESLAVGLGLVVGKVLGVFVGTYLAARFTKAELNPELAWADVFGIAVLAGIGFTVSLLISELAFPDGPLDQVKAAVLFGSLASALLAALLLRRRNVYYERLYALETADSDQDGVPDIYQR